MTLITKKAGSTSFENYQPISCMGILPYFISRNEAGFLKDHHICDNVTQAQEFPVIFNCKGTGKWACVTLDFHKAFDSIKWDLIGVALKQMGFDDIFMQLIYSYASTSSLSVIIKGLPREPPLPFAIHHHFGNPQSVVNEDCGIKGA